jgi:AraC family transcriptional regulator, regulatory protein of adaptative response / methylated-DNA-[protein]-cysteine methyltransferase
MIETAEPEATLAALANAAGLSPFHFHRMFQSMTGVTPKRVRSGPP